MIKTENLKIWLDAETINLNENENVTSWIGKNSTTINASNPEVSKSPILKRMGDLNFVYFDGTQRLDFSNNIFSNNNDMTIIVLTQPISNGHILGIGTSGSPYYPYLKGLAFVNDKYGASARNNSIGMLVESTTGHTNKLEIISTRFKNRSSNIKTPNGTTENTTSTLSFYPYTRATIGASDGSERNSYINPFVGYISEILVYDTYLTDVEIEAIEEDIRYRKLLEKKLLIKTQEEYKYFDSVSNSWLNIEGSLNLSKVRQYGVSRLVGLDFVNEDFKVVGWVSESDAVVKGNISAIPKPQLVYPTSDISLVGVETIDKLTLLSTGNSKITISFDSGITQKVFKNGIWETVENAHSGMTNLELNALTSSQIELERNGSTHVRFSYSLSDNAEVDSIEMKVTLQGTERLADTSDFGISYDETTSKIIYSIKRSGSYSVNFVDV